MLRHSWAHHLEDHISAMQSLHLLRTPWALPLHYWYFSLPDDAPTFFPDPLAHQVSSADDDTVNPWLPDFSALDGWQKMILAHYTWWLLRDMLRPQPQFKRLKLDFSPVISDCPSRFLESWQSSPNHAVPRDPTSNDLRSPVRVSSDFTIPSPSACAVMPSGKTRPQTTSLSSVETPLHSRVPPSLDDESDIDKRDFESSARSAMIKFRCNRNGLTSKPWWRWAQAYFDATLDNLHDSYAINEQRILWAIEGRHFTEKGFKAWSEDKVQLWLDDYYAEHPHASPISAAHVCVSHSQGAQGTRRRRRRPKATSREASPSPSQCNSETSVVLTENVRLHERDGWQKLGSDTGDTSAASACGAVDKLRDYDPWKTPADWGSWGSWQDTEAARLVDLKSRQDARGPYHTGSNPVRDHRLQDADAWPEDKHRASASPAAPSDSQGPRTPYQSVKQMLQDCGDGRGLSRTSAGSSKQDCNQDYPLHKISENVKNKGKGKGRGKILAENYRNGPYDQKSDGQVYNKQVRKGTKEMNYDPKESPNAPPKGTFDGAKGSFFLENKFKSDGHDVECDECHTMIPIFSWLIKVNQKGQVLYNKPESMATTTQKRFERGLDPKAPAKDAEPEKFQLYRHGERLFLRCVLCHQKKNPNDRFIDEKGRPTSKWHNLRKHQSNVTLNAARMAMLACAAVKVLREKDGCMRSLDDIMEVVKDNPSIASASDWITELAPGMRLLYGCTKCLRYPTMSCKWWRCVGENDYDKPGMSNSGNGEWRCPHCGEKWGWSSGRSGRLLMIGEPTDNLRCFLGETNQQIENVLEFLKNAKMVDEMRGVTISVKTIMDCIDKHNTRVAAQLSKFKGHRNGRANLPEMHGHGAQGKPIYCEDERLSLRWPGTSYGYFDMDKDRHEITTITPGDLDYILEIACAWIEIPATSQGLGKLVKTWFWSREDTESPGYQRNVTDISTSIRRTMLEIHRGESPTRSAREIEQKGWNSE